MKKDLQYYRTCDLPQEHEQMNLEAEKILLDPAHMRANANVLLPCIPQHMPPYRGLIARENLYL